MYKSTVMIRTSAAAAALLCTLVFSADARGQNETGGHANPATMPTPTGMLYTGGVLVTRPNGQWGFEQFPVVTRVDSGSVSAQAGLRLGDVLLSVNGKDARDAKLFRREHGEPRWVMKVRRGAQEMDLTMEVPPSMQSGRPPRR